MKPRVLLGMSGGVDSSVAAMILQERGYEVSGVSIMFFGDENDAPEEQFRDAKLLAEKLQIEHFTIDLRTEFKQKIIDYFTGEYKRGNTPFPCAKCNPEMKFHALEKYAEIRNCEYIATGHYARIKKVNGKESIFMGVDPDKDQSFFLWGLKPDQIKKLIFPLGEFTKREIRNIASERGFHPLAHKKDSLGICFINSGDYRDFLKKNGAFTAPGNFVDRNGNILGRHTGIANYTIGQRRGLGIHLNYPVFVAEIRLEANEIVLAEFADLYRTKVGIKDIHISDNQGHINSDGLSIKMHYRRGLTPCSLNIQCEGRAEVRLLKPEAMIANGQTAVFYEGERLVGGGFIDWSE